MAKLRLHQVLAKTGHFRSKSEIIRLIESGKVKVGDSIVKNPSFRVNQKINNIYYDNALLKIKKKVYFIFNKPVGVNCQKNQENSVFSLIKNLDLDEETKNSLFCIGRLDVDSSGLLIITNDGVLTNNIINPENKIKKTYLVKTDKPIEKGDINLLKEGVVIYIDEQGYKTKRCDVFKISNNELKIMLSEGKKRQIRKMLKSLGYNVIKLKRIAIGNLYLGSLKEGEFKELKKDEIYDKTSKQLL